MMHAVLDGEAGPGEAGELERLLAADPAAKARFDDLKRLFDGLAAVPKAFPPEGLVASVMAALPHQAPRRNRLAQLFQPWGVIRATSKEARVSNPGMSATVQRVSEPGPLFRGTQMNEQKSGSFNKRKVWIGVAAAVAAVAIVAATGGIDFSSTGKDAIGTIVPAERYRAPQLTADDVKLGTPSSVRRGSEVKRYLLSPEY